MGNGEWGMGEGIIIYVYKSPITRYVQASLFMLLLG